MCVYEARYNEAIQLRKKASDEFDRCEKGIKYFEGWKEKVQNCINCLNDMSDQTKNISGLCEEILLNGKRIDEGENHYPNGNTGEFAIKLTGMSKGFTRLLNEINKTIEELTKSRNDSQTAARAAQSTINNTPKLPCGQCVECVSSHVAAGTSPNANASSANIAAVNAPSNTNTVRINAYNK